MPSVAWKGGGHEIDVRIPNRKLTKREVKEYTLTANTHSGEWDFDLLKEHYVELGDLGEFGISIGEIGKLDQVNDGSDTEWVGMPEFEAKEKPFQLIVSFDSEQQRNLFVTEKGIQILKKESKNWITCFPFKDYEDLKSVRYE